MSDPEQQDAVEVYRFPASFAQQRLWLIEQLAPPGSLYSIYRVLRLTGELDVAALRASLQGIVDRHEALRTTFALEAGELFQQIRAEQRLDFTFEDLREVPESTREQTLAQRIREECGSAFDLRSGPLFRCRLLQRAHDAHVLIMNMHHIVADGWSLDILNRELSLSYRALSRQQTPALPELPIQYADFSVWQRECLSGDTLETERAYWVQRLADVPPLELPRDRPRPARQTYNGAVHDFEIPQASKARLLSLGRDQGATPYMTLLAAYLVLLHRYSGQDDFCVGSPITNRGRIELEPLIGFFVNTVVIRARIDPDQDFRTFLTGVRETALDAYTHQQFPFEKIVESLNLEHDRSRPPVVQVMFSFNDAGRPVPDLDAVHAENIRDPGLRRTSKFDLTLFVTEQEDGLGAAFEYNTDLFDAATIEALGRHFQKLIDGIVDDPEAPVARLPLLSPEEYRDLVYTRNATATHYPDDADLATLLHAAIDRTPDAIALEYGGEALSYRELDRRANQIAWCLKERGAGSQSMIGIGLRPSLELIVATAAVIKIGAVYVPLDIDSPRERLQFLCDDVGAELLVTHSDLLPRLPRARSEPLCVDRLAPAQDTRPPVKATADAPAYVIYTSGSTGEPKGVNVPHRAIVRLVLNSDYVRLDGGDRIAQISNFAFDAATFEIWGALLNGARLVVFDRDIVLTGERFTAALAERRITTLFLTTALFNVLAQHAPAGLATLKQVLFGGEAVEPRWVRRVLDSGPPERLLHVYGPTENTTFSTWYEVASVAEHDHTIPIGRPIANTQAYVLDRHLQPVPPGVRGELYLGGDGLAIGYWQRPQLTRERFVDSPFVAGARLYRSGDLVRGRADGNIEFLERNDNQVKLRGFRVELGEIEARIKQHPSIQDSVVMLRRDDPDNPRLVAYIVLMPEHQLDRRELQRHIGARLPGYMVPAVFACLKALPLNANGKVDRGALPAPQPDRARPLIAASAPLEQQLIDIWRDVLGTAEISVDDNFFELGGHSLLGVQLLFEIEKQLNQQVPLNALFESPTVAGLAASIRDGSEAGSASMAKIQTAGGKPPFFCVHGDPSALGPYLEKDQPYYFLHLGVGDKRAAYMSAEELAAEHLREVREIQADGPYFLGGFSFGGLLAYEMARQLTARGESVALLALFDPTSPRTGYKTPSWNIPFHLRQMAKSNSMREQLTYALRRLAAKTSVKLRRVRRRLSPVEYRAYMLLNKPIPPAVVFHRNYSMFRRAALEYTYEPYPGPVTLFHPETGRKRSRDYYAMLRNTWSELTEGRVDYHVVPGTSRHLDLFREPYTEALAAQLTACLARAQHAIDMTAERN